MLSNAAETLVIAAHPDDEVLGVGGTIPLLRQAGANVTVLVVTDGSSTQYRGDDAVLERKRDQMRLANERMGTTRVLQWAFPDMRLDTVPHHELNDAFEAFILEHRFDTLFVHGDSDINLDHRMIFRSAMVAARPRPGQPIRHVLTYHVNSSTEWGGIATGQLFAPNLYVDIGATIDTKLHAMEAYTDELRTPPHPRSIAALRSRAAVSGGEVGVDFAEPFRLVWSLL